MAKLIGSAPNQISTNGDLGSMAFEDRKNYATIGSSIHQPFRNLIINGDMSIAQRGTSFTGSEYTLDRWRQSLSGGTATVTQETFSVGSEIALCKSYLRQDVSTGDNYLGIMQRVESVRSVKSGGSVTFSFYAKGTNPAGGGL